MAKFDGQTISDDIRAGRRKFKVTRLPNFLALQFKRFTKNNFFIEKNPTLVTFPVKNLDLKETLQVPLGELVWLMQTYICLSSSAGVCGSMWPHMMSVRCIISKRLKPAA